MSENQEIREITDNPHQDDTASYDPEPALRMVQYLKARYDEEEELARKATPGKWKLWGMTVMADQDGTSNADTGVEVAHTVMVDERNKPRTFDADHIALHDPERVLADIAAKRAILEMHEAWPVLVEGEWEDVEIVPKDFNAESQTLRMTRRMAWMTGHEYRKRFGIEPATGPLLYHLIRVYADRPDFDPEWGTTAEPASQDSKGWNCTRCGSPRWVGWRAGPEHDGWPPRAQCVPCGNVQALPARLTS